MDDPLHGLEHAARNCGRVPQVSPARPSISSQLSSMLISAFPFTQVVTATTSIRQIAECPSRRPRKASSIDRTRRVRALLARECNTSDEQCSSPSFFDPSCFLCASRLTRGQMSYAEQSDKIAGTIALLKQ